MGYVGGGYTAILLPGIVALNGFLGALQNTTMPLTWILLDEGDRGPVARAAADPLVAVEKILFGRCAGWSPRW